MKTSTPNPSTSHTFDALGRYILRDFQQKQPFSSFLPGIAGPAGIPLWVFYVNRGQAICSFGIESKDHPILEFQSANKAYQTVSQVGFRTFLKLSRQEQTWHHEAFAPWQVEGVERSMFIGMNELELQEIHPQLGYQINVLYFLLPNLPFPGLVRKVSLTNTLDTPLSAEMLDGLPNIIPYGVDNSALKDIGRTIEAWMQVDNLEERLPFYSLKATSGDSAEVSAIHAGNYAFAISEGIRLPVYADPVAIFGMDAGLSAAHRFYELGLDNLNSYKQTLEGRSLGALFGNQATLAPGKAMTITSVYGYAPSLAMLTSQVENFSSPDFLEDKLVEARELAMHLTEGISTHSAFPLFDAYSRQTYLDNILRGGFPLVLGGKHVCHIYSRKHGDIERDYNYFVLSPEYFSQGNGNYRDIIQNRRNDVFFESRAGLANIRLFMSLIQADGYNPLVIKKLSYTLSQTGIKDVLRQARDQSRLRQVLEKPFTPGQLRMAASMSDLLIPIEDFVNLAFSHAEAHVEAEHGEGFWVDHWTYNLDLVESYLAVFPDQKANLLFASEPLPFYDNSFLIQPHHERYVLSAGKPSQLNAIIESPEKLLLIDSRTTDKHWARAGHGHGAIFRLPLISKFALLALIKFATLDPGGMGIQMEAGKPGWYDALNGLPGLFGSSLPETCELLRLVRFLLGSLEETPVPVTLPIEANTLVDTIMQVLALGSEPFQRWLKLTEALESYRTSVQMGFDGRTFSFNISTLLSQMSTALEEGIRKANVLNDGFPPTYLRYDVTDYALTGTQDVAGRPHIALKSVKPVLLPAFLEGIVRQVKISEPEAVRDIYARVRASELYDQKLQMYRLNSSLESQPFSIGRARAFTPGWLENGSIWMHMAFKYLLELQRAGLYQEFWDEIKHHLPAFMDPDIYGRSVLENSSFIASSAHPDANLHGNGFVARLSGATAEFVSMWLLMTCGKQPFHLQKGELVLELKPCLPGWMFSENGDFKFRFLGTCDVTLHNPSRKDTFNQDLGIEKIILHSGSEEITIPGALIGDPFADRVRKGEFSALDLFYK